MSLPTQSWYTIEPIDEHTFAISEYGHWEQVHSYLFIGQTQAALIDTGTGIAPLRPVIQQLTDLPIVVITTHCHWDHIGNHREFERIAIQAADRVWLEEGIPVPVEQIRQMLVEQPFTLEPPASFSVDTYTPYTGRPTLVCQDGDTFDLGSRILTLFHTPGHSPGHSCVYEEQSGYLVTGDLLYEGTLYANYPSTDPQAFQQSIRRLTTLPTINRLLPGHNRLAIPVTYLRDIDQAFQALAEKDLVKHGTGLQRFGPLALLF